MKYKIYSKTETFLNNLREDIHNTKTSIYIEMYIFGDDLDQEKSFVKALIQKAEQGIHTILILDAFGSRDIRERTIQHMKEAGIEILFFSDWLRRTHRKLVILDEQKVFFGGANIKQNTKHRLDIQIKISGKKIIRPFIKTFAYTYKMCGGKSEKLLGKDKQGVFKKIRSFLIENLPGHKIYKLTEYYREKMIHAKESIKITTPYFMPPRRMMALLDDANRRGVNIEIIIPYDTDIKTLNKINYYYINKLMNIGVQFYGIGEMNHSKMMIIDNKEGVVGSQNIDYLSFSHNFEIGAFFTQKELVQGLVNIFDERKKQSTCYRKLNIQLNLRDKIIRAMYRTIFYII